MFGFSSLGDWGFGALPTAGGWNPNAVGGHPRYDCALARTLDSWGFREFGV